MEIPMRLAMVLDLNTNYREKYFGVWQKWYPLLLVGSFLLCFSLHFFCLFLIKSAVTFKEEISIISLYHIFISVKKKLVIISIKNTSNICHVWHYAFFLSKHTYLSRLLCKGKFDLHTKMENYYLSRLDYP